MQKSRPILYSPAMSKATIEGRKTQTRRVVESALLKIHHGDDWKNKGRYGKPGDLLWVREEHYRFGHWREVPGVKTKTGKQKWAFIPDEPDVLYSMSSPLYRKSRHPETPEIPRWHKRLARFMPRVLSRTTLEITEVRVERLHDISEEDAIQEGIIEKEIIVSVENYGKGPVELSDIKYFNPASESPEPFDTAAEAFFDLWEQINGIESMKENPWVWVICFKVLS